jgi:hypothetical protein
MATTMTTSGSPRWIRRASRTLPGACGSSWSAPAATGHQAFTTVRVGSQVRNADTFGVLELTLRHGGYGWRFRSVPGATFTDAGAAACH